MSSGIPVYQWIGLLGKIFTGNHRYVPIKYGVFLPLTARLSEVMISDPSTAWPCSKLKPLTTSGAALGARVVRWHAMAQRG